MVSDEPVDDFEPLRRGPGVVVVDVWRRACCLTADAARPAAGRRGSTPTSSSASATPPTKWSRRGNGSNRFRPGRNARCDSAPSIWSSRPEHRGYRTLPTCFGDPTHELADGQAELADPSDPIHDVDAALDADRVRRHLTAACVHCATVVGLGRTDRLDRGVRPGHPGRRLPAAGEWRQRSRIRALGRALVRGSTLHVPERSPAGG